MAKQAFCDYVVGEIEDSGREALRVFLPAERGYILHWFIHSVKEACGCDTWRLGPLYHVDDTLTRFVQLTRPRAEWEMALRLKERPDFIGGVVHGDERMTAVEFRMDGKPFLPCDLRGDNPFTKLEVTVCSEGFDPNEPQQRVLLHGKTLTFTAAGVDVCQRVEWLGDYLLGNSYMAMMPPLKEWTDRYKIDTVVGLMPIEVGGARGVAATEELYLCGDAYGFSMRVPRYLSKAEGNQYLITDNGGSSYNKMYFVLAHGGSVRAGDVWETETVYHVTVFPERSE